MFDRFNIEDRFDEAEQSAGGRAFSPVQMGKFRVMMGSYINEKIKKYNLSSIHAMYIALFKKQGSLSQKDATQFLQFDKSHSSRVFNELIEKGIIKKAEGEGGKMMTFVLTDYGGKIANDITNLFRNWQQTMYKGVEPEDIKIYNKVQQKIFENCMEELIKENSKNKENK